MTLPQIVAYAILFLVVAGIGRVIVAYIVAPALRAHYHQKMIDVIARFRRAYNGNELDIEPRLYQAVNTTMTQMAHCPDNYDIRMYVRYKTVLVDKPVTPMFDNQMSEMMAQHSDATVRKYHEEWVQAFWGVVIANSPGAIIYMMILILPVAIVVAAKSLVLFARNQQPGQNVLDAVIEWVLKKTHRGHTAYKHA